MKRDIDALLVLPRIRVQNANAISSPLNWGFPSPSAFTGFTHALYRKTKKLHDLEFGGVGIVCHSFDPQIFSPPGRYNQVFRLMRHPNDKDGGTPAFVEEGRAHMDISLVIGLNGESLFDGSYVSENPSHGVSNGVTASIEEAMYTMRLAGGSILGARKPYVLLLPSADHDTLKLTRNIARRLLPGFALISRNDLLVEHLNHLRQENSSANSVDALLDMCSLAFEPQGAPQADDIQWTVRGRPGWIVPIPVGYGAISDLYPPGVVKNARDQQTSFRFVESLSTLGQWISPHRIADIRELLWYYFPQPDKGLYQCANTNQFNKEIQKEI